MQGIPRTRTRSLQLRHKGLQRWSSRMALEARCLDVAQETLGLNHRTSSLHLHVGGWSTMDVPKGRAAIRREIPPIARGEGFFHGVLQSRLRACSHREPRAAESSRAPKAYASHTALRIRRSLQQEDAPMAERIATSQTYKGHVRVHAVVAIE